MSSTIANKPPVQRDGSDELMHADYDAIGHTSLTPREHEVMEALSHGLGSKYAARELHISYETIRTHQRNIYKKLGARTLCNALNLYRSRYARRVDTYS